jgi:hypothetical protein
VYPPFYAVVEDFTGGVGVYKNIRQKIEYGAAFMAGKLVTISFTAWSPDVGAGDLLVQAQISNSDSGGTFNVIEDVYLPTDNLPHRLSVALDCSALLRSEANHPYVGLTFSNLDAGGSIAIAEVQVEIGDVATDYERLTHAEQMALCQRYYLHQTTTAVYRPDHGSSTSRRFDAWLTNSMARSPTISWPSATGFSTPPTLNAVNGSLTHFHFYGLAPAANTTSYTAGITFDAEL